jgi:hypothetical protein
MYALQDFGKGFYLTDIEQQAKDMAIRKSRFVPKSSPCVLKYGFDENYLKVGTLQVKVFEGLRKNGHNLLYQIDIICE